MDAQGPSELAMTRHMKATTLVNEACRMKRARVFVVSNKHTGEGFSAQGTIVRGRGSKRVWRAQQRAGSEPRWHGQQRLP